MAPYDAAGWTLAYMMNVQFDRIQEDFNGPFLRIPYGELQSPEFEPLASASAYLLNAESNNAFTAVNDLLNAGQNVFRRLNPSSEGHTGNSPGQREYACTHHQAKSSAKIRNLIIRESLR